MKNKSKLKTIADAFLKGDSKLPREEEWFQDRISACNGCQFNSKNVDKSKHTLEDKLKITSGICTNKEHCTLCGCCIYQKASEKVENCALLENKIKAVSKLGLNNTPENLNKKELETKWKAIAVETKSITDLDVSSVSKTVDTLYLDINGDIFNVQLKETSDSLITFDLVIHRKAGLKIISVTPACSCTVPAQVEIDDKTVELKVKLSTTSFTANSNFERVITIRYYINERSTKQVKIKLIGKKI